MQTKNYKLKTSNFLLRFAVCSLQFAVFTSQVFALEGGHPQGPDLSFLLKELNFLILVAALFFLLKKPVREYFAARAASLRKAVNESKQTHDLAAQEYRAIGERLKNIQNENRVLLQSFREEGELGKKKILEQAAQFAQKIRDDARRVSESELKKAKEELKETTILLARELAEKTIRRELGESDDERLANSYLERLRRIH